MKKAIHGFSMVEILVVVSIFTLMALLVTQTIANSTRSSKKNESMTLVRSELDHATAVMSTQLKTASSLTGCVGTTRVNYRDRYNNSTYFTCTTASGVTHIASGSASIRLTSDAVNLTGCKFTCIAADSGSTDSVLVELEGVNTAVTGVEQAKVSTQMKINLRNY